MTKHTHGGDVYRFRNYIDYSANLNPLGLPEGVRDALVQAANQVEHYPDVQCQELVEAIATYEKVEGAQYFCGNGAAEVIFSLCLAVKPSKALLLAPTFAEYEQALLAVDCQVEHFYLKREKGFLPDEELLDYVKNAEIEMLFFCNPNNPTGVLSDRNYLKQLLDICSEKNIWMVVDECFLDFVTAPETITLKQYLKDYKKLFILKAFTKRYAMAGVRLGYGITGNEQLIAGMEAVTQPWNVSTLAQAAGVAALKEEDYVQVGREIVFKERDYLVEHMKSLGLKVYPPAANYIFFEGPSNLEEQLKQHKILIRNCSNYIGLSKGDYRIAVRSHEDNTKLIEILKLIV